MNKNAILVVLGMITGLLAGCGGGGGGGGGGNNGSPPPTTSVAGTVSFKGAPLAGATVVAFNTNTNTVFGSTTTDANGSYSFSGMGTSCADCLINYQFFVYKSGYAFVPSLASNPSGSRSAYQWDPAAHSWYVPSGSAVTRQDYFGQYTIQTGNGGSGIMHNVVNFMSVPNGSITGANFSGYDGSNPLVSLAATGQTTSFAVGDDAALQKGVAWPAGRFVDHADGTVTDQLTGLTWLKNAGCFTSTNWANALNDVNQLASGACGLSDGSSAGQWRLPNLHELESLVNVAYSNPAITPGSPFFNVSNGIYWTSTSYYGGLPGSPSAWAIRMSDGRYINDGVANAKTSASNAVWAVKGSGGGTVKLQATGFYVFYASGDDGSVQSGAPLTFPRMRDNGNGTVTDTVTGLVWLKKADCINQTWASAVAAVNALGSGQCGLSDGSQAGDWRLPNRNEMLSLADRAQNNMADYFDSTFTGKTSAIRTQPPIFSNFVGFQYYWTSTTDAFDTTSAWAVFSCDYGVYDQPKSAVNYALAVR
jgi:hypothetical protein